MIKCLPKPRLHVQRKKERNKPGRLIQCVPQAVIIALGGFAEMATDGRTLILRCEDASTPFFFNKNLVYKNLSLGFAKN